MNKLKVAIYTRVSTSDQNLDVQIEDLKEFAKKRKWEILNLGGGFMPKSPI